MLEPIGKPTIEKMRVSLAELDTLKHVPFRRRGATLATGSTREFGRVPGLALADWAAG